MAMDKEFEDWLNRNRYGSYKGIEIKPETQMVSYTYVISLLVITYRKHTRYYFLEAEREKAAVAQLLCTLCNLILGWWGFPWGPVFTIKETFGNLVKPNIQLWGKFAGKPEETQV